MFIIKMLTWIVTSYITTHLGNISHGAKRDLSTALREERPQAMTRGAERSD
jgi:hypothetical protein